jgi:hypothetical protein
VPTPEDLDRIDRVHALITTHSIEFREAGTRLDSAYSPDTLHKRAQEYELLLAQAREAGPGCGKGDAAGLERIVLSSAIPEYFTGGKERWFWDEPTRRWDVVLFNLISGRLPIATPNTDWTFPSEVILIYWITCDERAENGPDLSVFQKWSWNRERPFGRNLARCWVDDWPKLNSAVDYGLALAQRRGLAVNPPDDLGVRVAIDSSWIVTRMDRFEFTTPRQRQIIDVLYTAWVGAGKLDGSGVLAETICDKIGAKRTTARLRIDKIFQGNPALGTILRKSGPNSWALYLRAAGMSADHGGPKKDH